MNSTAAEAEVKNGQEKGGNPEKKGQLREWTEALIFALILALIIRAFLIQAYRIPSSSMEDTLLKGDNIFATKYNYGVTVPFTTYKLWGKDIIPKRGDIIIFTFPENHEIDFVKRVIGLPGDTVEVRHKKVFINGTEFITGTEKHTDRFEIPPESQNRVRDNLGPFTVKPGHVFAMGDNRDQSYDSRFWGQLPLENIKGKALIIYFSWDRDNFFGRLKRIGHIIR
jgi:signal peptidase I